MTWLNPGRWLAVAGVLAVLWGLHWWDKRQAVELVRAEYRGRDQAAAEVVKMDAKVRERRAKEADDAHRKRLAVAAADRDRLRAERDGLLDEIAARRDARAADPAAGADGATTGEELLAECGRAIAELADSATAVQTRLRGLQEWVTGQCR